MIPQVAEPEVNDVASEPVIRLMELADIDFAVRLHGDCLPTGFFVQLGRRFLAAYYRSYLTSPAAIGLVAEQRGKPVGFLVGTVDRDVHHRHVARAERLRLAVRGATALAVRPRLATRFIQTRLVRYLRGLRRMSAPADGASATDAQAVLSHVAVAPEARRTGLGHALVARFVEVVRSHGTRRVGLLAHAENAAAESLYGKMGWQRGDEKRDVDGVRWVSYTFDL